MRFPHEELKTIYYQELDYKKAEGLVSSFKKILDFNLTDKNDFVKHCSYYFYHYINILVSRSKDCK